MPVSNIHPSFSFSGLKLTYTNKYAGGARLVGSLEQLETLIRLAAYGATEFISVPNDAATVISDQLHACIEEWFN